MSSETPQQAADWSPNEPQARQQVTINIDDSKIVGTYANFCRVTGMPEELIIDFGLNPQPIGMPSQSIQVTQRIITNYFTAKRMLGAIQETIRKHEQTFGIIETDIQKRIRKGNE